MRNGIVSGWGEQLGQVDFCHANHFTNVIQIYMLTVLLIANLSSWPLVAGILGGISSLPTYDLACSHSVFIGAKRYQSRGSATGNPGKEEPPKRLLTILFASIRLIVDSLCLPVPCFSTNPEFHEIRDHTSLPGGLYANKRSDET